MLAGAAAGCVAEHDVDVYVVLPAPCADLGAARVTIDVTTADGERFSISTDNCTDRLADQELSGFQTTLERLGSGYHRADIAIEDADGAALGTRSLPFPSETPLVVSMTRADLPGWPTAELAVTIPACIAGNSLTEVQLSATLASDTRPAVDVAVGCDAGSPASPRVVLPRGPAKLIAKAPCWYGEAAATVEDGAAIELELARSCP
jgi:hypothetical protein